MDGSSAFGSGGRVAPRWRDGGDGEGCDLPEHPRYGRLLRYVYLEDEMANARLVANGYAHALGTLLAMPSGDPGFAGCEERPPPMTVNPQESQGDDGERAPR